MVSNASVGQLVVARISVKRPRAKTGLGPPTYELLEITEEDPQDLLDRAAKILAEAIPREEILATAKGGHSDDPAQCYQRKAVINSRMALQMGQHDMP